LARKAAAVARRLWLHLLQDLTGIQISIRPSCNGIR
jgi:hypothetical protein